MNYVQPIRDKKKIQTMKTVLKAKDEKYYIMFLIGINVGLRVSDILTLKVSDVRDRTHINIVEKKTGKTKRFLLNSKMQAELTDYISKFSLSDDDYLIRSRKGKNQPIRRDRKSDWTKLEPIPCARPLATGITRSTKMSRCSSIYSTMPIPLSHCAISG